MATNTNITPALTAEEWTALNGTDWHNQKVRIGDVTFRLREESVPVGQYAVRLPGTTLSFMFMGAGTLFEKPAERHGIAALALHGMPFGFTHGDVNAIHDAADYIEAEDHVRAPQAVRLHALAERIVALLPPEEPR